MLVAVFDNMVIHYIIEMSSNNVKKLDMNYCQEHLFVSFRWHMWRIGKLHL